MGLSDAIMILISKISEVISLWRRIKTKKKVLVLGKVCPKRFSPWSVTLLCMFELNPRFNSFSDVISFVLEIGSLLKELFLTEKGVVPSIYHH